MDSIDRSQLLGTARRSSAETVYEAVKRAIFDGTIRPGERIVEEALGRSLGVSRTPVREALLRLERENLVARGDRGLIVRSFTAREIEDLMLLRARVEGFAARLAAERAHANDIATLQSIHEEARGLLASPPADEMEWLRGLAGCNRRFHMAITQAAGHEVLGRILIFVQVPFAYQAQTWYDDRTRALAQKEHQKLIDLIAAKDADGAEAAMVAHVAQAVTFLVPKLSSPHADFAVARDGAGPSLDEPATPSTL
jgi:DNA-binding GntR family transcriptional regulator